MPLDGLTPWQPSGWTIRIGPADALLAESRHWSGKKRRVFQELAVDAAYAAIDAIQLGHLYKRRDILWNRGSWIRYFFRLGPREKRTILITIFRFHFFGPETSPDGPDGGGAALPVNLLTFHVSGGGRRFRIDRVEGIRPLPRPPASNHIVPLQDVAGEPGPGGRRGRVSVSKSGPGYFIYYSPRGLNGNGDGLFDASPHGKMPVVMTPGPGILARLWQALPSMGLLGRGKARSDVGSQRAGGSVSNTHDLAYAAVQGAASVWRSTAARTRLRLPNHPRRPEGLR